jgi:OPA family glycerol-3-phosphate transporter-like MFS transporter
LTPASFAAAQRRVLLLTSLCYLLYYLGRQNFGWTIPGLREDLGLSNTEIGWISGLGLVSYGAGQIVSGYLSDRVGGRRMVALGTVLSCGFNWWASFAGGFGGLLLAWALNNAAQSLGFAPASRLLTNWWGPRERGWAFGVFTFAAGLASVATFALAMAVLARLPWPWVFRLPVLLMPVGGLLFFAGVRDRPEDQGFTTPAERPGAPPDGPPAGAVASYREVLRDRRFVLASVGFGFSNWARLGLLVWAPVHFLGPSWKQDPGTAWITLALPVGMALGALAAGYGADRFLGADHARLIAGGLVLATVTTAVLYGVPVERRGLAVSLLFLAGLFVFGPATSFSALAAELVGRRAMGTATGFMNAVGYAAAAAGDLVMGVVLDAAGSTAPLFLVTAGACAAGAVCGALVRRPAGVARLAGR